MPSFSELRNYLMIRLACSMKLFTRSRLSGRRRSAKMGFCCLTSINPSMQYLTRRRYVALILWSSVLMTFWDDMNEYNYHWYWLVLQTVDLHGGYLKLEPKKHSIGVVSKLLFFINRQIEACQTLKLDRTSMLFECNFHM